MKNLIEFIKLTKYYYLYELCSSKEMDELLLVNSPDIIINVARSANLTNKQFLFLLNINDHYINYNLGSNDNLTENQIDLLLNKNDYICHKHINAFQHPDVCKGIAKTCKLNQAQIDFILNLDYNNAFNLLINKHLSTEQKEKIIERSLKQEVFK